MELQLYSCFKSKKSDQFSLTALTRPRSYTRRETLLFSQNQNTPSSSTGSKVRTIILRASYKNPPPNTPLILRIFSDFLIFSPVLLSRSAVVWLLLSVCGVWAQRRECVVTRARARSCTGERDQHQCDQTQPPSHTPAK